MKKSARYWRASLETRKRESQGMTMFWEKLRADPVREKAFLKKRREATIRGINNFKKKWWKLIDYRRARNKWNSNALLLVSRDGSPFMPARIWAKKLNVSSKTILDRARNKRPKWSGWLLVKDGKKH